MVGRASPIGISLSRHASTFLANFIAVLLWVVLEEVSVAAFCSVEFLVRLRRFALWIRLAAGHSLSSKLRAGWSLMARSGWIILMLKTCGRSRPRSAVLISYCRTIRAGRAIFL